MTVIGFTIIALIAIVVIGVVLTGEGDKEPIYRPKGFKRAVDVECSRYVEEWVASVRKMRR